VEPKASFPIPNPCVTFRNKLCFTTKYC